MLVNRLIAFLRMSYVIIPIYQLILVLDMCDLINNIVLIFLLLSNGRKGCVKSKIFEILFCLLN